MNTIIALVLSFLVGIILSWIISQITKNKKLQELADAVIRLNIELSIEKDWYKSMMECSELKTVLIENMKEVIKNHEELDVINNKILLTYKNYIQDRWQVENIPVPDILGTYITEPEEVLHENHGGC